MLAKLKEFTEEHSDSATLKALANQSLPSSVPRPHSGGPESDHERAEAGRVPPDGRPQEQPGHRAEDQTGRPHGQTPQHEAQRVSLRG